jgi:manganese-transporting P-type ATPase
LQYIKVFARMTPDAKEKVIECLHSVGLTVLMCGDGGNDVGALKSSDVGVALLSGFGNINVGNVNAPQKSDDSLAASSATAIISREHLDQIRALPVSLIKAKIRALGTDPDKYPDLVEKEDLVQVYQIKAREVAVRKHDQKNKADAAKMTRAEQQAESKRKMAEKQEKIFARVQELEAQGEKWAMFKAMKEFYAIEVEEAKKLKGAGGVEGSATAMLAQFEEMDSGELPMIKLGDASIAAPFTSKIPSIRNCVDIVRQGRCTLVSSLQMVRDRLLLLSFVRSRNVSSCHSCLWCIQYQIMALQCLISSYSLSVLYFEGVKYGDTQYTAMGMLGSVSALAVSRSRPLDKLSRVRPLNSIFHPALFISLLGQFAIHLTTMYLAVQAAKKRLPPDYDPDLDGIFKPGILNTVVFLVVNVQQCMVYFVNLQGRPFMTSITENTPLLWSLAANFILTFMFANESVPGLNRYFQLVPFPDPAFRDYVLTILVVNLVATFALDRLMHLIFSRDILMAGLEGTTATEVFKIVRTFFFIGFIMYSFMGDSDKWDLFIEMQANGTLPFQMNHTVPTADTVTPCVGEGCGGATRISPRDDEF